MAIYNTTADTTTYTADTTALTADADPFALPDPVTRVVTDYTGKITPWQSTKARFVATVSASVAPFCDAQAVIASLPGAFDIDYAIGAQLDVVGQWVGRSRLVKIPLPNAFFSFDIDGLGWDQGYWQGPYDGADGISFLPDDLYRRLLYTKIAANSWDGTTDAAEAIVRTYLADTTTLIFLDDGGRAVAPPVYFAFDTDGAGWDQGVWYTPGAAVSTDVKFPISYAICLTGKLPSALDLHVLANDLIPVKSAGAQFEFAVTTVDGAPLFGFDMDDEHVSGFDVGAWGSDPATVAGLIS